MTEAEPQINEPMLALMNEETEGVFQIDETQDFALVGACLMVPKDMLPGLTPRLIVEMFAEHIAALSQDSDVHHEIHSAIPRLGSN